MEFGFDMLCYGILLEKYANATNALHYYYNYNMPKVKTKRRDDVIACSQWRNPNIL